MVRDSRARMTSVAAAAWMAAGMVAWAAASSCGGAQSPSARAPETPASAVHEEHDDPRLAIDQLSAEIDALRARAGMSPAPDPLSEARPHAGADAAAPRPMTAGSAEPHRPDRCDGEPVAPACVDMCTLSASICANADKICRLAGQLRGDAWAAGKCSSARTSCADARERCCDCAG